MTHVVGNLDPLNTRVHVPGACSTGWSVETKPTQGEEVCNRDNLNQFGLSVL